MVNPQQGRPIHSEGNNDQPEETSQPGRHDVHCSDKIMIQNILPFLGKGHGVFMCLVSRRMKELWCSYFATANPPPPAVHPLRPNLAYSLDEDGATQESRLEPGQTTLAETFSTPSRASFWKKDSHDCLRNNPHNSAFAKIARWGTPQVLLWAVETGLNQRHPVVSGNNFLTAAAQSGNLAMLRTARGIQLEDPTFVLGGDTWTAETFRVAASLGNLPMIKCLILHLCPFDDSCTTAAIRQGHLQVLEFMTSKGAPVAPNALEYAAFNDNADCAKFIMDHCAKGGHTPEFSPAIYRAARLGNNSILTHPMEQLHQTQEQLPDEGHDVGHPMEGAARGGHLETLKLLVKLGCLPAAHHTHEAARTGHLECLQFLFEQTGGIGARSHFRLLMLEAIEGENAQTLLWLLKQNPEFSPYSGGNADIFGHAGVFGNKEMVDALLNTSPHSIPPEALANRAAGAGHLELLKCLREEKNCPWNLRVVLESASLSGKTEILECLGWDVIQENVDLVTTNAIDGEMFHVLAVLQQHGVQITPSACETAATSDHLPTLKRLREWGVGWGRTSLCAAENLSHHCLIWAIDNDCPLVPGTWNALLVRTDPKNMRHLATVRSLWEKGWEARRDQRIPFWTVYTRWGNVMDWSQSENPEGKVVNMTPVRSES